MKLPIFLLVLLFFGCMPYGTDIPLMSELVAKDVDTKIATLDNNGVIAIHKNEEEKGFLVRIKDIITNSFTKFLSFFGIGDQVSSFCQRIREESPTAADFIKNWSSDDESIYCAGNDDKASCGKKHDDAFQKGLLCYQAQ